MGENPIVFLVLLCLSLCWTPIKFDIVEVALFLSGAKENHLTPIPLPPAGVTVSENFCKNTILFNYYYHENEQFFSEIIFCSFTEVPEPSTIISKTGDFLTHLLHFFLFLVYYGMMAVVGGGTAKSFSEEITALHCSLLIVVVVTRNHHSWVWQLELDTPIDILRDPNYPLLWSLLFLLPRFSAQDVVSV